MHADYARGYYISVFKDGQKIVGQSVDSGEFTMLANQYGEGEYSAYCSCVNSKGAVDSSWINFNVVGKAGYSKVSKSAEWYDLKDTISISVDTVCAKGQVIGIDKVGGGRVITIQLLIKMAYIKRKITTGIIIKMERRTPALLD